MAAVAPIREIQREAKHAGLRLTAEEYFALRDDGNKYELIDGVVVMSPSATPRHQQIASIIHGELYQHIKKHKLGVLLFETDVQLKGLGRRGDVVYRPEIIFIAAESAKRVKGRITVVPDVVVEIISPESRALDTQTKYADYEKAGVREYWVIDPVREEMHFYRLEKGKFKEARAGRQFYESEGAPGFRLELKRIREAFRAL